MSATVAASPQKTSLQYFRAWDLWALVIPMVSLTPLLLVQAQRLMNRPERQFFPVLVLIACYLPIREILQRADQPEQSLTRGRMRWTVGILSVSILISLLAALAFAPWSAHVAAIGIFVAWCLGRCSWVAWTTVAAWAGLLLVTLPLPFDWDAGFISWLQGTSAAACGFALDALAVPHMRMANVIEIKGQQLFVEEACSGIASLYALLAAGALMVLINSRSFLCTVLVIASVPIWAMFGNFLRLLSIALAQEYYQRDLSHGLDHELLGLLTFSLAAMGLWMTEWLLSGFLQPLPPASPDFNFVFKTLNAALCWPATDPLNRLEESGHESPRAKAARLKQGRKVMKRPEVGALRVHLWQQKFVRVAARSLAGVAIAAGILPAVIVARDNPAEIFSFGLSQYTPEQLAKLPGKEGLPEKLGAWSRVNFSAQSRSTDSFLGAHSLIWEYRKQEHGFLVSIDFPFRGYHPLEVCYGNSGWEVERVEPREGTSGEPWAWKEIVMSNEFGSRGYVCYCLMTDDCEPFENEVESAASQNVTGRLRALLGSKTNVAPAFQPVCYQIQLLIETGRKLTDEEKEDLRQQFVQVRQVLREQIKAADVK